MPEFGLGIQGDKGVDDYIAIARIAEDSGFDVISVYSDLMYQPPIVPLTVMAGATEHIRLGPACLNPFSLAPFEIAGQIAALDLASSGRAYLGLSRGAWLGEVGVTQRAPITALADAIEVVRRLLAGDTTGFEGQVYRLAPGTGLRYEPLRADPPVLIGTWGPRTARLAGRVADEVKIGGSANPDMVPVMRSWLGEGAEHRAGRPEETRVVVGAVTVVDHDGDAARDRARTEVAKYLTVVAELDPTLQLPPDLMPGLRSRLATGDHVGAGRLIPDHVLDAFAISGTPAQVKQHAARLIDAGAKRVEFGTPHGLTWQRGLDLLGTEVLPELRRMGGNR
jgi:5,10-methylenetetrahydromethanopterin reductase